jgi:hypothetical protein
MRSRSARSLLALAAIALIASSCSAGSTKTGVKVGKIPTNVGLGIEAPLNAAPPNIAIVGDRPVPHQQVQNIVQPTYPPFPTAAPTPKLDCPVAGPFDFPSEEANPDPDPSIRPAPGDYRYKLDGTVTTDAGPETIDAFETRTIRDVVSDSSSPNAFDYTVSEQQVLDERSSRPGTVDTTYRVAPTGNFAAAPNPPAAGVDVTDQGRGVFILKIVFHGYDDQGHPTTSTFQPNSAVQLLQYPVTQGATVSSTGADSSTGSSLQIKGTVAGKKQVDACGHRQDSWLVNAEEIYQYTDPKTLQTNEIDATYNYAIATQYGGWVIYEHTEAPKDNPIIKIDARVGEQPRTQKAPAS